MFTQDMVTTATYTSLLREVFFPEMKCQHFMYKAIFQQNSAHPRTSDESLLLPRQTFQDCVTSSHFPPSFNTSWA